jgi:phosphoserine phosphatase
MDKGNQYPNLSILKILLILFKMKGISMRTLMLLSVFLFFVIFEWSVFAEDLPVRNWDAFNHAQIEKLVKEYGNQNIRYDKTKPPYAVFDWDNTCIFLDIEEATFAYMLQFIAFKSPPELLNKAIRNGVGNEKFTSEFHNLDGKAIDLDLIAADIIESYDFLYQNFSGLQGGQSLNEIRKSPHYLAFVSKMRFLYDAIDATFGHEVSYPWLTYIFAGMTAGDVKDVVRKTVEWQLKQSIENVVWTTPAGLPGNAGRVSVTWKNGLRLVPEMQDLLAVLRKNGIDVWICSASFVDVIKGIACYPQFGYGVKENEIIAMELERDGNGIIQPVFRNGYEQTQGKGKTKNSERFLVVKYGYGPIFVAGDSTGDENMMADFKDTKLSLIINRLPKPSTNLGKFAKQAVAEYQTDKPRFLLQGRDDNTGKFMPTQGSRPLLQKEIKFVSFLANGNSF